MANPNQFSGLNHRTGVKVSILFGLIQNATASVIAKMSVINANKSAVSIGDMFEMQMLMNKLSQVSEMASNVVAALNSAAKTMAQNVRG